MENTYRHYPLADFGPTLRAGRTYLGLGLRETARLVGIQPGYLTLLEQGKRSPSQTVAERLIIALRLTEAAADVVYDAAVAGVGRDLTG